MCQGMIRVSSSRRTFAPFVADVAKRPGLRRNLLRRASRRSYSDAAAGCGVAGENRMTERDPQTAESARPSRRPSKRPFANAILLMVAQVAAMPLSLVNNAVVARYLGADDFGLMYLVASI